MDEWMDGQIESRQVGGRSLKDRERTYIQTDKINRQTQRQMGVRTGRQTSRQAGRQAGRQTDRRTDGWRWTDRQINSRADREHIGLKQDQIGTGCFMLVKNEVTGITKKSFFS